MNKCCSKVNTIERDIESLLSIRSFEETLLKLFRKGIFNGTTHTCIGQEYIPVSIMTSLKDGDFIFSNHRGHGHYLARYNDFEGLLSEIMGRQGAVCKGVGGSQHLYREDGFLSTGIQGESLPLAAGVAKHFKESGNGGIAVVFIGDGTWGEGSVYEALNMSGLWQLPLVVVVENNGISQSTPSSLNLAGTIEGRVRGFDIEYLKVTSNDVWKCREMTAPFINKVRQYSQPLVIEFKTNRLGPHSKGDDTRSSSELDEIKKKDWLNSLQNKYPQQVEKILPLVQKKIDELVCKVSSKPLSEWNCYES